MAAKQPCVTCKTYPKAFGKQRCIWCWLEAQPIDIQIRAAHIRKRESSLPARGRVPAAEWPEGERWCAGCRSFVPLFYVTGSRCKACASEATHGQHVLRTYGITPAQYELLFTWQRGRCALCGRRSLSRRLAVDHNHTTGEVRGLLCPDPERGCNHAVLGPIESASIDGALAMAKRIVDYLERSPVDRIRAGEPRLTWQKPAPTAVDWGDPPF